MNKILKQAVNVHSALCVEDILRTAEKGQERIPWVLIVSQHMEQVIKIYERNISRSGKKRA